MKLIVISAAILLLGAQAQRGSSTSTIVVPQNANIDYTGKGDSQITALSLDGELSVTLECYNGGCSEDGKRWYAFGNSIDDSVSAVDTSIDNMPNYEIHKYVEVVDDDEEEDEEYVEYRPL